MLRLSEKSANLQTVRIYTVLEIVVITEFQDGKSALKAKRLHITDRFHLGQRGIVRPAQVPLEPLVDRWIQRLQRIARCGSQAFARCHDFCFRSSSLPREMFLHLLPVLLSQQAFE